jgi:hypothetical protein
MQRGFICLELLKGILVSIGYKLFLLTFCVSLHLLKFSSHDYLSKSFCIYSLDYYGCCASFCNALFFSWIIVLFNAMNNNYTPVNI